MKRARTDATELTEATGRSSRYARRQLGRLRPKYRKATSYKTKYDFERVVEYDTPLNLNSGFNGNGYGISFGWTLDTLIVEFGNGSQTLIPISGSADFENLFDQWKIERVDMEVYFSRTTLEQVPSTSNYMNMPIIRYVTDLNDFDNDSTIDIKQYPQVKTAQFGEGRKVTHTCWYPSANVDAQLDVATSVASMNKRSPWCSTAVPGVAHHGIKVRNVPFDITLPDATPDVNVGGMKFVFKVYYSLKLAR